MPRLIESPTRIKAPGNIPKVIEEYVGHLNSNDSAVSIARMVSSGGWTESGQRPEFDEFVVVLAGMLRVKHESGVMDVRAGQAISMRGGEWVQYSTPEDGGAEYIAVCLPAFLPGAAHPDE